MPVRGAAPVNAPGSPPSPTGRTPRYRRPRCGRRARTWAARGRSRPVSVNDVLDGVRVLEVAAWTFVPAAGAVLAEWGADVIKVEPREGGDPQRGLVTMGLVPEAAGGVNYMIEMPNRGKKSIGIDLSTPGGREVVLALAKTCDVFLTSYLPGRRERFGIDLDDIRAVNPDIIYVRGSGYGPKGPDADRPGYDGVSFWSRGGVCDGLTPEGAGPIKQTPAFGDLLGGMTIAGGIAAALYKRKATGETSVVDVSLLGLGVLRADPARHRQPTSTVNCRFRRSVTPIHRIRWWATTAPRTTATSR